VCICVFLCVRSYWGMCECVCREMVFGAVCGEIVVWILRKRRGWVCVEMGDVCRERLLYVCGS